MHKDGTWKALKAGKTELSAPIEGLSEESIKAINEKYPNATIVHKDIAQAIQVEILPLNAGILVSLILENDYIQAKVGEAGQLTLKPFENNGLKATFKEIKNDPYFELNADGSWRTLKSGEVSVPIYAELSDETIQQFKEKYPNQEIRYKPLVQNIYIKVAEDPTVSQSSSTTTAGTVSGNGKELPKTGEQGSRNHWSVLLGLTFCGSFLLLMFKKLTR